VSHTAVTITIIECRDTYSVGIVSCNEVRMMLNLCFDYVRSEPLRGDFFFFYKFTTKKCQIKSSYEEGDCDQA